MKVRVWSVESEMPGRGLLMASVRAGRWWIRYIMAAGG